MKFINLTPHEMTVRLDESGTTLVLPKSNTPARCQQSTKLVWTVETDEGQIVPIYESVFGEVYDLPALQPGTAYVVSVLVAIARPDRTDLLVAGPAIRDESGRIVACDGLSVV